jgi:hypothetical protein
VNVDTVVLAVLRGIDAQAGDVRPFVPGYSGLQIDAAVDELRGGFLTRYTLTEKGRQLLKELTK